MLRNCGNNINIMFVLLLENNLIWGQGTFSIFCLIHHALLHTYQLENIPDYNVVGQETLVSMTADPQNRSCAQGIAFSLFQT